MTMSADEARAWLARWREVEQVTLAEARALTPAARFRQLESLMSSADLFAWPSTEQEDERVRDLWIRLHALHGR